MAKKKIVLKRSDGVKQRYTVGTDASAKSTRIVSPSAPVPVPDDAQSSIADTYQAFTSAIASSAATPTLWENVESDGDVTLGIAGDRSIYGYISPNPDGSWSANLDAQLSDGLEGFDYARGSFTTEAEAKAHIRSRLTRHQAEVSAFTAPWNESPYAFADDMDDRISQHHGMWEEDLDPIRGQAYFGGTNRTADVSINDEDSYLVVVRDTNLLWDDEGEPLDEDESIILVKDFTTFHEAAAFAKDRTLVIDQY
jgi:hypothetical protein